MLPAWVAIAILSSALVVFLVHLYLKYSGSPRPDVVVEPGSCCWCTKEEPDRFFCRSCCRRLLLRYTAILAGILCLPLGALAGLLIHLAVAVPAGRSVFGGIIVCVLLYNAAAWLYAFVYMPDRIRWYVGLLGFGFGLDPRGISFTFRGEWWRFRLLLKQLAGASRTESSS